MIGGDKLEGVLFLAHIERRGQSSFRLTVDLGRDANGKRHRKYKTIRIDDEALLKTTRKLQDHLQLELRKFQLEVQAGNYVRPSNEFFHEFVKTWFKRHVDKELSEKSGLNYRWHINNRIMPHFEHMRMNQITAAHINDFLDKMQDEGVGGQTIMYSYRVLRSVFRYAAEWQVIAENPILSAKKPPKPERRKMQVYDEADLERLFDALDSEPLKVRCIVMLAVTCGLRRGEIIGLEWDCIDLEKGTVKVEQSISMYKDGEPVIKGPKTQASIRTIAMPGITIEQLAIYKQEWDMARKYARSRWAGGGSFLFCHEDGKPHDPHWITDMWGDLRRRHDLKHIRFHDLRHTAATWMIKAGIHPKAISNRLGHVSIKTTMDVYAHVLESVDQEAANVFDLMPTQGIKRGELLGAKWGPNSQKPLNEAINGKKR